jgi:hypothetical protein
LMMFLQRLRQEQQRRISISLPLIKAVFLWHMLGQEHTPYLECILQDINRPYMKDVTHLHGWQFFHLANHL